MASEAYIIHDPAGPDIEFEGELLVEKQQADIGNVKVYRTCSGKIVVEQRRNATRERRPIDRVAVFEDLQNLPEWLGYSVGAKAVLEQLGRPMRKKID